MTCNEKLEAYLREQGVPFEKQRHTIAFTAQEVAASEHLPSQMVAKVVMVLADSDMVMLVLPASHRTDLTKVAAALGARDVRLASEHEFAAIFGDCDVGAMPPFGNLYGIPVYVDQTLTEDESIVFQAGTHTDTICMSYADYAYLVSPMIVEVVREGRAEAEHV
jgi:Ala-tRNA(Pro) deacylase